MDVNTIRVLDHVLGNLICFFLGMFKIKRKMPPEEIKKILLIKIWGIGSIIYITPSISEIKSKYPNSKIYLLTMINNKELYENNKKDIEEIYSVDLKNIFTSMKSILKNIFELRKQKIDVLIDFEISPNATAIIGFFIKPKFSIGHKIHKSKDRLYDYLVRYLENEHIIKIFKEVLKPLNIVASDCNQFIQPGISNEDKEYVESMLKNFNIQEYIIININASPIALERRLPLEKFKEIADYVLKEFKLKIVLIGSNYETEYVNEFKKNFKEGVYNLAGKTNLLQLFYLIKNSRLLISNDSGPLHLGVLGDVKTISFFGPETPLRYGPIGEKHSIIYNKVDCSPCMSIYNSKRINCRYNVKCLNEVPIGTILKAVDRQLK